MLKVNFHKLGTIKDNDLIYAVIVARHNNKWIFSKHKQRDTWEIPGGHRKSEDINKCASRELIEETGAKEFELIPLCIYSVEKEGLVIDYGQLFFAEIKVFDKLPDSEIEKIDFFDNLPNNLTYPLIQPFLFKKALEIISETKK